MVDNISREQNTADFFLKRFKESLEKIMRYDSSGSGTTYLSLDQSTQITSSGLYQKISLNQIDPESNSIEGCLMEFGLIYSKNRGKDQKLYVTDEGRIYHIDPQKILDVYQGILNNVSLCEENGEIVNIDNFNSIISPFKKSKEISGVDTVPETYKTAENNDISLVVNC